MMKMSLKRVVFWKERANDRRRKYIVESGAEFWTKNFTWFLDGLLLLWLFENLILKRMLVCRCNCIIYLLLNFPKTHSIYFQCSAYPLMFEWIRLSKKFSVRYVVGSGLVHNGDYDFSYTYFDIMLCYTFRLYIVCFKLHFSFLCYTQ